MGYKEVSVVRQRMMRELQELAAYTAEKLSHRVSPCHDVRIGDYRVAVRWYMSLEHAASYSTLAVSRGYDEWRAITDLGPMGSVKEIDGMVIPIADEDAFLFFAEHANEIVAKFEEIKGRDRECIK